MTIPNITVNYVTVLIAAVVSYIIGFLWYGPLFGKVWMKEMSFSHKDMERAKKKGMWKLYLLAFIGTLITSYVLAHFVQYVTAASFNDALQLGFWLWLGFFAASTLLGSVLWEGKSWKLFFLNGAYWLINLVVMSYILSVWK